GEGVSGARGVIGTVAAIAVVWAIDWAGSRILNPYIYRVLVLCSINVILALSLNLVNGITGQFSIGHAGFMAVGAYASAAYPVYAVPLLFGSQYASNGWLNSAAFLLAVLVGGRISAAAGFPVGRPSRRLPTGSLA